VVLRDSKRVVFEGDSASLFLLGIYLPTVGRSSMGRRLPGWEKGKEKRYAVGRVGRPVIIKSVLALA